MNLKFKLPKINLVVYLAFGIALLTLFAGQYIESVLWMIFAELNIIRATLEEK